MSTTTYAIEIHHIAPLGFFADVVEVLESGRDGEVKYSTRIYDDPDYVQCLARQWIDENT
jgi:hypothetical protein